MTTELEIGKRTYPKFVGPTIGLIFAELDDRDILNVVPIQARTGIKSVLALFKVEVRDYDKSELKQPTPFSLIYDVQTV